MIFENKWGFWKIQGFYKEDELKLSLLTHLTHPYIIFINIIPLFEQLKPLED